MLPGWNVAAEMLRPAALELGPYLLTAWTTACKAPDTSNPWTWLKFLLFAPCPQHVLISSLHIIFIAVLTLFAILRLLSVRRASSHPGNGKASSSKGVRVSPIYTTQVAFIVLVTLVQWSITLWRTCYAFGYGWQRVPAQELVYSITQAVAWTTFGAIVGHEKKNRATMHSSILRAWWIMTFLFSLLALYTGIARFIRHDPHDIHLWIDGIQAISTFPVVVLLALVAGVGKTGIFVEDSELIEHLLGSSQEVSLRDHEEGDAAAEVTGYQSASFISKATWLWLNPLLKKGKSKALEPKDIPLLSPDDRAELVYSRFVVNLDAQGAVASVRTALLNTFWPQLVFTAFLAVSKLSVMYVGPILINQFVEYVAGRELFPNEGLVLVAILFTAKVIEVLSAHQFNFLSQKLGMVVRSSLITTVYRKGLRLSSFARQTHGAGQIVNYMSVDVQQIADLMLQIHNLWVLPLQAAVALVILYSVIGVSCFGGILVMLCILFISFNVAKKQRTFQGMIMRFKDKRMGITTEVLNNMKIIKLQVCGPS